MKKTMKAKIKSTVLKALSDVVSKLKISKPTKKTRKAINTLSKALREELKSILKKKNKSTVAVKTPRKKNQKRVATS